MRFIRSIFKSPRYFYIRSWTLKEELVLYQLRLMSLGMTFVNSEDMKLICVYQTRTDLEYLKFERMFLLKHNRLG
jgi:hypothetical protein